MPGGQNNNQQNEMNQNRNRNIRKLLKKAIKELKEARFFSNRRRFERAEDEVADAVKYISRALKKINQAE